MRWLRGSRTLSWRSYITLDQRRLGHEKQTCLGELFNLLEVLLDQLRHRLSDVPILGYKTSAPGHTTTYIPQDHSLAIFHTSVFSGTPPFKMRLPAGLYPL